MLDRQDDGLGPFRGLCWGILLSIPLWITFYIFFIR